MEIMEQQGQIQPKIPPKLIKIKEIINEEEQKDRISALPDCLILEILSRLPSTKDAITTGTLSKRWIHLWTSVDTLIFEHHNENHDFSPFVDETLAQCHQLKLNKFKLYIKCDVQFESQVNNWISYAVNRNVEELNLWNDMNCEAGFLLHEFFYTNSCFTDVRLVGCVFNPSGAISWNKLRSLYLSYMELDENLIENILSGSPVLETLVLHDCYGYRRIDITSKSVKNLAFYGYMDPEEEFFADDLADVIEINAPYISSLTIKGDFLLWKLLLLNVSSLVKADLDYTKLGHYETTRKEAEEEMLSGFILNLRHVKELMIGIFCFKVLSRLEAKGFISPSNLKVLDVTSPVAGWSDSDSLESGDWEELLLDHDPNGDEVN